VRDWAGERVSGTSRRGGRWTYHGERSGLLVGFSEGGDAMQLRKKKLKVERQGEVGATWPVGKA
jgi:hypothetical protein